MALHGDDSRRPPHAKTSWLKAELISCHLNMITNSAASLVDCVNVNIGCYKCLILD